jgi:hypothetical protein
VSWQKEERKTFRLKKLKLAAKEERKKERKKERKEKKLKRKEKRAFTLIFITLAILQRTGIDHRYLGTRPMDNPKS